MAVMSKERKKPSGKIAGKESSDRHVPSAMMRVDKKLHAKLKTLAKRHDRPIGRELRRILVEEFRKQGLWTEEDDREQEEE